MAGLAGSERDRILFSMPKTFIITTIRAIDERVISIM
jgi:hypothetical protein